MYMDDRSDDCEHHANKIKNSNVSLSIKDQSEKEPPYDLFSSASFTETNIVIFEALRMHVYS